MYFSQKLGEDFPKFLAFSEYMNFISEFEFAELIDNRKVKEKQNVFMSETLLISRNLCT